MTNKDCARKRSYGVTRKEKGVVILVAFFILFTVLLEVEPVLSMIQALKNIVLP